MTTDHTSLPGLPGEPVESGFSPAEAEMSGSAKARVASTVTASTESLHRASTSGRNSYETIPCPPGLFPGPVIEGRPTFSGPAGLAAELGFEALYAPSSESPNIFADPGTLGPDTWVVCRPIIVEEITEETAAFEDLISQVWLHADSNRLRREFSPEQRALFDRSVRRSSDRLNDRATTVIRKPSSPQQENLSVSKREGQVLSFGEAQKMIAEHAAVVWPGLTTEIEVMALTEEVGEVARAALKRTQAIRGSDDDWTAELRREVGDVVLVLCNIADLEGFELADTVSERLAVVLGRDPNHDPVEPAGPPTV